MRDPTRQASQDESCDRRSSSARRRGDRGRYAAPTSLLVPRHGTCNQNARLTPLGVRRNSGHLERVLAPVRRWGLEAVGQRVEHDGGAGKPNRLRGERDPRGVRPPAEGRRPKGLPPVKLLLPAIKPRQSMPRFRPCTR